MCKRAVGALVAVARLRRAGCEQGCKLLLLGIVANRCGSGPWLPHTATAALAWAGMGHGACTAMHASHSTAAHPSPSTCLHVLDAQPRLVIRLLHALAVRAAARAGAALLATLLLAAARRHRFLHLLLRLQLRTGGQVQWRVLSCQLARAGSRVWPSAHAEVPLPSHQHARTCATISGGT